MLIMVLDTEIEFWILFYYKKLWRISNFGKNL